MRLLPPRQRAVFLLTQAFEFTADEVAAMLGMTKGAVKAALHRARNNLDPIRAEPNAPVKEHDPAHEALLAEFLKAFDRKDPEAIAALLDQDVEVDILGVAQEIGPEEVKGSSLRGWSAEWDEQSAKRIVLEGEPVLAFFEPDQ